MKVRLNADETDYCQTLSRMGITMLVFLFFMKVFGWLQAPVAALTENSGMSAVAVEVAGRLLYALGYAAVFMLPVVVLRFLTVKQGCRYRSMRMDLPTPKELPVIVLGGILLIWTQSYLNSAMVSVVDYASFSSEVLWGTVEMRYGYQIVLQFITVALVPAFCEEFLFRGAILTNLLPFGRTTAILVSSLLFAMMHQNAEQILYAFAAGILLGVIYERSGSIWSCVLLHLFNNFVSFALEIVAGKLDGNGELGWAVAETALCLVCFGCLVPLVRFLSVKSPTLEEGVFGKSVTPSDSYGEKRISSAQKVRLFFNVPMILFFALTVFRILLLIGMAWGYRYGT